LIKEMTSSDLLPGVLNFLESSKNEGIKIGLGSSSKNAPLILKTLNITGFFDCIVDGNSVTKSKPNPEVFLSGASQLNLQPNECIVFEDAIAGVDAALAGGFLCIGDKKTLNKATYVHSGFEEFDFKTFIKSFSQYERSL
jgi:beta-phosphoglucomutase